MRHRWPETRAPDGAGSHAEPVGSGHARGHGLSARPERTDTSRPHGEAGQGRSHAQRQWLSLVDVGLTAIAGAVWYLRPETGAWPLALVAGGWLVRWLATGKLTRATALD